MWKWAVYLGCLVSTGFLHAQIPAGLDAQHPQIILMNTDSIYSQYQTEGWFKFNTGNVSNVGGNLKTLKATVLISDSRVVQSYTVEAKIMNLYDMSFNLLASDTLQNGDTSITFSKTLSINTDYYLQIIANYPCGTCTYPNSPIAYRLGIGENPVPLCEKPGCGFMAAIGNPATTCTYPCVKAGGSGMYSGPCIMDSCIKGCARDFSTTASINFCDDNIPDDSVYLNYLQNLHNSKAITDTVDICNPDSIYIAPLYFCAGAWNINCTDPFTVAIGGSVIPTVYVNLYNTATGSITNYSVSGWPFHLPPNALQPGILYVVDYTIISALSGCGPQNQFTHSTSCCQYYLRLIVPPSVTITNNSCATTLGTVCVNYHFPIIDTMDLTSGTDVPSFAMCKIKQCVMLAGPNLDPVWEFSGVILNSSGVYTTVVVNLSTAIQATNPDVQICYNLPPDNYTLSVQLNIPSPCYCNFPTQFVQTFTVKPCCTNSKSNNVSIGTATLVSSGAPPVTSLSPGGPYSGVFSIPPGGWINSMVFTVQNKLTIQSTSPVTFNRCDILFADGAALDIAPNTDLTFNQTYLHSCGIWRGIQIMPTNQLTPLTIKNSVIEDASTAVDIANISNGYLNIQNSVFNKNWVGVNLHNALMSQVNIQNSVFTSRKLNPAVYNPVLTASFFSIPSFNTFLPSLLNPASSGSLNASSVYPAFSGKRGNTGIVVSGNSQHLSNTITYNGVPLKPIVIGVARTSNSSPAFEVNTTNLFDHLNQGVVSMFGAQTMIINSRFRNMKDISTASGGLQISNGAAFSGIGGTLLVGNFFTSPTQPDASRYSCDFQNCKYGILFSTPGNTGYAGAFNNRFQANTNGIYVSAWNAPPANPNKSILLSNNTGTANYYFLNSFNNQSIFLSVQTNTINGGTYGIYINDVMPSNNLNYYIFGNRLNGMYFGIHATNTQNLQISANTFTIQQWSPFFPPLTNPQVAVNIINAFNNQIDNNYLKATPPAVGSNTSITGIRLEQTMQNNIFCNTIHHFGTCIGISGLNPAFIWKNELGTALPQSQYGIRGLIPAGVGGIPNNNVGSIRAFSTAGNIANGNTWGTGVTQFAKYSIYNMNQFNTWVYWKYPGNYDKPASSSPPVPMTFTTTEAPPLCATASPSILNTIIPQVKEVLVPNTTASAEMVLITSRQAYRLIRHLNATTTPTFVPLILMFESGYNTSKFYAADSLANLFAITKNPALLSSAKTKNAWVIPKDSIELIQKQFNEIYYKFLEGDSLITGTDISQLQSIAGLCPYRLGTAVFQARALLKKYDSTDYYNACEGVMPSQTGSGNRMALWTNENEEIPFLNIKFYPNPLNQSDLYFVSNVAGTLKLLDVSGRVVALYTIREGKNKLNTGEISPGLYLLQLEHAHQTIWTSKLIKE